MGGLDDRVVSVQSALAVRKHNQGSSCHRQWHSFEREAHRIQHQAPPIAPQANLWGAGLAITANTTKARVRGLRGNVLD